MMINKIALPVQRAFAALTYRPGVIKFFIIFYLVGITGMTIPALHPLFIQLIPLALLLSAGYIIYFHKGGYRLRTVVAFLLIFILGMGAEIAGTNTGLVFGNYWYGSSLGIGIFSVPLMVGVNWMFMVYSSSALFHQVKIPAGLKVVSASFVMVIYDLVLEQSAPMMDMWYWENDTVPFQNYLAWFALALVFHSLLKIFRVNTGNPVAVAILICQFMFFLLVYVLNSVI